MKPKRWWLNPNQDALGCVGVEGSLEHGFIELTIRDCTRSVTLSFDCSGWGSKQKKMVEKGLTKAKHKLSVLRRALDEVENRLDIIEEKNEKL